MTVTRRLATLAVGLLVVMQARPASAAAGDLDPSFGGDGHVHTIIGSRSADDRAEAVTIQQDGRIVVAGWTAEGSGRFALARYLPDGTLDMSFGRDGKVTVDFGPRIDAANAVAIQPDGKIVVAGVAGRYSPQGTFALARLQVGGALDTSFGGDGRVTTDFSSWDDAATAVVVRTDGTIVAVGGSAIQFGEGPRGRFAVARYLPDGTLDGSFGGDGKVTTDVVLGNDGAAAAVLQTDGKVIAAGQAASCSRFALVRYAEDGSLDESFGADGVVLTNFSPGWDCASSAAIQPDGRIVAAGVALDRVRTRFAVARYLPDGSLDPTFGSDGKVETNAAPRSDDRATNVAIQANGRIVAGGAASSAVSGQTSSALVRYRPGGLLDDSFGGDGRVLVGWGICRGVEGMAIQADGRIVGAGWVDESDNRFATFRLLDV